MINKKTFSSFCLSLLLINSVYSQTSNPIFYGGAGDGYSASSYKQASITNSLGGIGDGYTNDNYLQSSIKNSFGGIGDGYSENKSGEPITYRNTYGGIGDGWTSDYLPLSALPFINLSLSGYRELENNILTWQYHDNDINIFEIERSNSNSNSSFKSIGKVLGHESKTTNLYKHIDDKPLLGKNYYRLKMFQNELFKGYSNIILIMRDEKGLVISAYPNPTTNKLSISISKNQSFKLYQLEVYDVLGKQIVLDSNLPSDKIHTLDFGDLNDGYYTIRILFNDQQKTFKILKQAN